MPSRRVPVKKVKKVRKTVLVNLIHHPNINTYREAMAIEALVTLMSNVTEIQNPSAS